MLTQLRPVKIDVMRDPQCHDAKALDIQAAGESQPQCTHRELCALVRAMRTKTVNRLEELKQLHREAGQKVKALVDTTTLAPSK